MNVCCSLAHDDDALERYESTQNTDMTHFSLRILFIKVCGGECLWPSGYTSSKAID